MLSSCDTGLAVRISVIATVNEGCWPADDSRNTIKMVTPAVAGALINLKRKKAFFSKTNQRKALP